MRQLAQHIFLKGMKESGMDALERADRLLFMPDLFAYLFTGQPTNEFTIATTSRLIDAEKREWNRELIRELQLPEKIFYPLQEAGTVIGYLKKDIRNNLTNLEQTKVVMTACHDTASAVLTVPEKSGCSFYQQWNLVCERNCIPEAICIAKGL